MHATEQLDVSVLTRWKHLLAQLKSKNRTIANEDSLIAATALEAGHALVTDNRRHFQPAEEFGLEIISPLD
jgi:predicted nucleic acid-binding protein